MLEPLHSMPAMVTLVLGLLLLLALFFKPIAWLLIIGLILGMIILIISMIDSIAMYRQIRPALYLPLVMPAQIIGYGMGFIYNFIRRVILSKDEKVGFKKHYYK